MKLKSIVSFEHGITWVIDDPMQRASHALVSDGKVWLIDPVDDPSALLEVEKLGEIVGVIQLLDRHPRDCKALASRYKVPFDRLPDSLPGTPFQIRQVLNIPGWREAALWWPATGTLVVPETVGSNGYFDLAEHGLGIHPLLRVAPPKIGLDLPVRHLLVGHGEPVHEVPGEHLIDAYHRSRRDILRAPWAAIRELSGHGK